MSFSLCRMQCQPITVPTVPLAKNKSLSNARKMGKNQFDLMHMRPPKIFPASMTTVSHLSHFRVDCVLQYGSDLVGHRFNCHHDVAVIYFVYYALTGFN